MPNSLPSITKPTTRLSVSGSLKQVFIKHNPGVHWLILALYIPSVIAVPFLMPSGPLIALLILVPIVYFTMIIISNKRRGITLDDNGIRRRWLFGEFSYPYEKIHKIILVKDLTFVTGMVNRQHNGMALLVIPTDGFIPGFAGFRIGHQASIKPEDLTTFFQAFAEKDRVEFDKLTQAELVSWINTIEEQRKQVQV